jgi:capsular exopolysaccharide synthesis family protein
LLVTAATAYQDQATVAANLAIVAAQSGAETILVDADLTKSVIRQRFALPQAEGLSDLLERDDIVPANLNNYLQPTFVPGLRVLGTGSGSASGTALLLSSRLELITNGLRAILELSNKGTGVIIFHSAPVLSGVDASLIGAQVEQTVLSVIVGRTTRAQAKQAQEQLEQAHIKLAGIIMLHP